MALSLHSALLSFNAPVVGVPSRSALARSSVDMAENLSFLGTVDMDAEADKVGRCLSVIAQPMNLPQSVAECSRLRS